MDLFPKAVVFSPEEQLIIQTALTHPTVKRYLQSLAIQATTDHAIVMVRNASEATEMPAHVISAKFAGLAGQLSVFETLLSIKPADPQR